MNQTNNEFLEKMREIIKEELSKIDVRKMSFDRCINNIIVILENYKTLKQFTVQVENVKFSKEEIDQAYEQNTGLLIVNEFRKMKKDVLAVPAVLCKNHGPFTWGKDGMEAVHNAVVLEECAKMAMHAELINPQVKPAPQELQDKHYYRKHGANAYYGQNV